MAKLPICWPGRFAADYRFQRLEETDPRETGCLAICVSFRKRQGKQDAQREALDVGDKVTVKLVSTNPEKGFIDFAA
jgi:hypothetical protein